MTKQDLKNEKMSLAEAAGIAEKTFNGKAIKVEIEHENKSIQYDVFAYTPAGTHKYKIDSISCTVLNQD